jgi:hypothetical protein
MVDRGKHVDIIFRNGLKEFEVLPPPDVWKSIQPVLLKKQRSLNISRFAAIATILISFTGFSYWLTKEISGNFYGPAISFNQETMPSGKYNEIKHPVEETLIKTPLINPEFKEIIVTVDERATDVTVYQSISGRSVFSSNFMDNKLKKTENILLINGLQNISTISDNLETTPVSFLSEKTANVINRWTISAKASPNYYSNSGLGKNKTSGDLADSEKSLISYSGGMAFSYKVNKRMSIQSGIYYSSVGQKVTGISSYSGFRNFYDAKGTSEFSIQTSSGTIVSTNSNIFLRDNLAARVLTKYTSESFDPSKANLTYLNNSVTQNFNYLEIPLVFKYKAIDRKLDLNFVGGLSYNMLVGNTAFASVNGVKYSIGKTEGLSPVNFSSSFGLGLEYNLSEKISLDIEPTLRYYLSPMGEQSGSSTRPYSFGVFSGLSYKF